MIESNDPGASIDRRPDPRPWQAPKLTLLGDARSMTEAGGIIINDGGGNQMS